MVKLFTRNCCIFTTTFLMSVISLGLVIAALNSQNFVKLTIPTQYYPTGGTDWSAVSLGLSYAVTKSQTVDGLELATIVDSQKLLSKIQEKVKNADCGNAKDEIEKLAGTLYGSTALLILGVLADFAGFVVYYFSLSPNFGFKYNHLITSGLYIAATGLFIGGIINVMQEASKLEELECRNAKLNFKGEYSNGVIMVVFALVFTFIAGVLMAFRKQIYDKMAFLKGPGHASASGSTKLGDEADAPAAAADQGAERI